MRNKMLILLILMIPLEVEAQELFFDTVSKDSLFSYREFKHCFQKTDSEQLIPANCFTQFLYSLPERCSYYAIEMIEYSNGCDFFVIRQILDDEEKPIDVKLYLVFKNGELVDGYNPYSSNRILEIYIEGEGGVLNQSYKIENDSSITVIYNESECCLSTGHDTVIEHFNKVRYCINQEGRLQIKDILDVSFSSPFFDADYLNSNNPVSPQKDKPYKLVVKNMIQEIPIYQENISMYFYIKNLEKKKIPLFFRTDKQERVIDEYMPDEHSTSFFFGSEVFGQLHVYSQTVLLTLSDSMDRDNPPEQIFNSGYYVNSETGSITEIGSYKNGKKHGAFYYWTESGVLIKEEHYKYGILDGYYLENDLPEFHEGYFKNGKKHGIWKTTGDIYFRIDTYKRGVLHGFSKQTEDYSDFTIEESGYYKKGRKSGVWEKIEKELELKERIPYKKGLLSGTYRKFDDRYGVETVGHYKKGKKHGIWRVHFKRTGIIKRMRYKNDIEISTTCLHE